MAAARPKAGGKALTRKVGPLPVWAWGAAGLVIFLLVRHYQSGSSSAATPAATDTTGAAGTGTDTSGSSGGGAGSGNSTGGDSGYAAATYDLLGQLLVGQQQQSADFQAALANLTPAQPSSTTNNYYTTTPAAAPDTPKAAKPSGQPSSDFESTLAEPTSVVTYNPGPFVAQPQSLPSAAASYAATVSGGGATVTKTSGKELGNGASTSAIKAGQSAVNEKPKVVPGRGRAA